MLKPLAPLKLFHLFGIADAGLPGIILLIVAHLLPPPPAGPARHCARLGLLEALNYFSFEKYTGICSRSFASWSVL